MFFLVLRSCPVRKEATFQKAFGKLRHRRIRKFRCLLVYSLRHHQILFTCSKTHQQYAAPLPISTIKNCKSWHKIQGMHFLVLVLSVASRAWAVADSFGVDRIIGQRVARTAAQFLHHLLCSLGPTGKYCPTCSVSRSVLILSPVLFSPDWSSWKHSIFEEHP